MRVRRVNGVPLITYKAAKLPGEMKARRELEWRLDPGDPSGDQMEELLQMLSFRRVAEVRKERQTYTIGGIFADAAIVIDRVETLGEFAELELLIGKKSEIDQARGLIRQLSDQLGLRTVEPRSYLEMVLESYSGDR